MYIGENAARNRNRILEGLRNGSLLPDTYVITLPESGNHILDIRPVSLLRKEERESRELLILGIARGYGEAAEVVRSMIDDMYQKTGAFNWTAYMESLPKICGTEVDSRKQGEWTVAYCIAYIKNTGYPFAGLTGAFASGAACSPFCSCAVSASGDVERR